MRAARTKVAGFPSSVIRFIFMAKRKRRVFDVSCNMQVIDLTRAGSSIDLSIFADGLKLGEVQLGRGSLIWIGKWKGQNKSIRFRWHRFAALMNAIASGEVRLRLTN